MPVDFFFGSTKRRFFTDLSIGVGVILLFAVFKSHGDLILLTTWVVILGYLLLMKRYSAVSYQFLATVISILWVHSAKDYYSYQFDFVKLFGMSSLPLMAWSLLLFGIREYCNYYKFDKKVYNFLLFFLVFFFSGILFETVAYHVLHIRNTMTANYPGLPICDCIHAPIWMKVVYLALGPVYYLATKVADGLIGKMTGRPGND